MAANLALRLYGRVKYLLSWMVRALEIIEMEEGILWVLHEISFQLGPRLDIIQERVT